MTGRDELRGDIAAAIDPYVIDGDLYKAVNRLLPLFAAERERVLRGFGQSLIDHLVGGTFEGFDGDTVADYLRMAITAYLARAEAEGAGS